MSQSESFPPMGGDSASQSTGKSGSKPAKTIAGPRRVRLSLTSAETLPSTPTGDLIGASASTEVAR